MTAGLAEDGLLQTGEKSAERLASIAVSLSIYPWLPASEIWRKCVVQAGRAGAAGFKRVQVG